MLRSVRTALPAIGGPRRRGRNRRNLDLCFRKKPGISYFAASACRGTPARARLAKPWSCVRSACCALQELYAEPADVKKFEPSCAARRRRGPAPPAARAIHANSQFFFAYSSACTSIIQLPPFLGPRIVHFVQQRQNRVVKTRISAIMNAIRRRYVRRCHICTAVLNGASFDVRIFL